MNKLMTCESEVMCQTDMTEEHHYGKENKKEKMFRGASAYTGGGGGC